MLDGINFLACFERLLGFIYPETCRQCDVTINLSKGTQNKNIIKNTLFCLDCWEKVGRLTQTCCPVCGTPFESTAALSNSPSHRCGDCRADPPYFSRAITPYPYEGALAKAVQLLKYEKQTHLAKNLANLLFDDLKQLKVDLILAIPLHPLRLRSREFNQSLLLAKEISRHLAWPLKIDILFRIRETKTQVGLSKKDRIKNVERAFSVHHPEQISGKHLLLIDDVYTTGTTLKEGARALKKAGAKEVSVAAPTRMVFRDL